MTFKVHDNMPIPGKVINKSLQALYIAIKSLNVSQCLEVDTKDMNWSDRESGFRPERKHVLSRITSTLARIRRVFPDRRYTTRPMADTSLGVWRLEDKDA